MKKYVLITAGFFFSGLVMCAFPQDDEWCSNSEKPTVEFSEMLGPAELDSFVAYAKQAILDKDSIQIISCFGPFIDYSQQVGVSDLSFVSRDEFIQLMIDEFGSFDNFNSHLGILLHGFEMKNEEGQVFYTNSHVKVQNYTGELEVLGNYVNFRATPSISGKIICKLNMGMYSGMINHELLEVKDPNGFNWIPIRLHHPLFGMVSGYIAEDYVKELDREKLPIIEIRPVNGHWRIQSVRFISS